VAVAVTVAPARRSVLVAAIGGVAAAVLLSSPTELFRVSDTERLVTAPDGSFPVKWLDWHDLITVNRRLEHAWQPAFAMVRERPVLGGGYGGGTFRRLRSTAAGLAHEHSAYLAAAVQSGLLGLACWLALLGALVLRLTRMLILDRLPDRPIVAALLGSIVAGWVVHGIGEPVGNGLMGMLLGPLAGFGVALRSEPVVNTVGSAGR
jgi:O-antigen ligase